MMNLGFSPVVKSLGLCSIRGSRRTWDTVRLACTSPGLLLEPTDRMNLVLELVYFLSN